MNIQNSLILKSKKIAINSFKNFCKNINLEPDLFEHIYNIEIVIKNTGQDVGAKYDAQENKIILDEIYLFTLIEMLETKKRSKEKIELNLALTIVHEMIHANRTIFINNSLNINNVTTSKKVELNSLQLSKAIQLLRNIKSNFNLDYKLIEDNKNIDDYIGLASNFYYHYDKENLCINDKNISMEKAEKLLNKKCDKIIEMIFYQYNFEELITETLATIIIMSRNDSELNLRKINEKLITTNISINEKVAAKLIEVMGVEMLNWFMTSVYYDCYDNLTQIKILKKYNELLLEYYNSTNTKMDIYESPKKTK